MEREMMATQRLFAALAISIALPNALWAQQTDVFSQPMPHPPAPTCRSVRLQSQNGAPIAGAPVNLKVMQARFKRAHSSAVVVKFKLLRKLKTGSQGEVHLPNLESATYLLQLTKATKDTFGSFEIPDNWQPNNCTQAMVSEDKGSYVDLHLVEEAKN